MEESTHYKDQTLVGPRMAFTFGHARSIERFELSTDSLDQGDTHDEGPSPPWLRHQSLRGKRLYLLSCRPRARVPLYFVRKKY